MLVQASYLRPSNTALGWVETRPGHPYFFLGGMAWTPIGQNDAVSWPELNGLFRRRDIPAVETHLRWLKASGVTCLRLMLEYAQGRHRYFERPAGRFVPNMVQLWDDLFALCERIGLRILLTPFDTFFTWTQWRHHPYNRANGGPCASRKQLLTCPATRAAIKARLEFATRRWGGSGALFAWDLWNEAHPAHGGDDPATIGRFIDDVGPWLRDLETRVHGRAHPQTVSIFGPELVKHPQLAEPIFRHPALDFANTHLYETGTIDDPKDTVAPALAAGRLMRLAVRDAADGRPVFDSEHGPIHAFKDRYRTLSEPFDDEYHRHIQWAHLASGGAGGGMRWPNRHPHQLTPGMREAQGALARFLPLIEWTTFRRANVSEEVRVDAADVAAFACADADQAVVWLLRTDAHVRGGTARTDLPLITVRLEIPRLGAGRFQATCFDTQSGKPSRQVTVEHDGRNMTAHLEVQTDVALAVRRLS
ncbi:MAG TPA: hypothetical protein VEZ48_00565 [Sphingomonadaceae bacterium]|nr:hypothetical protein [Sphingomonadaceae bacterium]